MTLHQALFKSDVFRRSTLLIKSDSRCLALLKCFSTNWNRDQRTKTKIDQKFAESVRRQAEQRKTGQERISFVNPTNVQRKEQKETTDPSRTKKFKFNLDLPTGNTRVPIRRRLLNLLKSMLELGFGGRRSDAFFFYRDQMSSADNSLVYVCENAYGIAIGFLFILLVPPLSYRFIQLYRKEVTLSLKDKELDFNLKPWQIVVWLALYTIIGCALVLNMSTTVNRIYYNQRSKLFTLFIHRAPLFGKIAEKKLVVGVGQASEQPARHLALQLFYPNTKLPSSKVNIYKDRFTKPVYASLLYRQVHNEMLNRAY